MEDIIRIDGKDYVRGSSEARTAQERLDALRNQAFLEARPDLLERNVATIRTAPGLERIRSDANSTSLLARDLVFVTATIERTIYERTRSMEFVKPDTSYPRGAESYVRRRLAETGKAKISSDLAGDAPRVDVTATEDQLPFRNVRASYAYSVDDLERAAFARMSLPQWKREACINAMSRQIDEVGRSGSKLDTDGDSKLYGLFNNANVNVLTLANGEWNTETDPLKVIADLDEIETTIITQAKDTQPTTGYMLIVPTAYEGKLLQMRAATDSDISVAEFFLRRSRLIKRIVRWGALDSAVSPAIKATDAPQAVCIPMDQMAAGIYWPMPISYEELAPQMKGFEWTVEARARLGGVEFSTPVFSLYVENLD
jgi:hypothetical protein